MSRSSLNREATFLIQNMTEHADTVNCSEMISWIDHFLYSFALIEDTAPQEARAMLDSLHQYMHNEITTQEYQVCIRTISTSLQETFAASTGNIPIH